MPLEELPNHEKQGVVWDYFKPRHTHSWNMLVLSWRSLDGFEFGPETFFEDEYLWENFIIRLWLYRTTVKTLTRLDAVADDAKGIIATFDRCFEQGGRNGLKAIRDMIEHFDDYAAGVGRGPATREGELDPWRTVTPDRFERGRFALDRVTAYDAAIQLRADAKHVSDKFIDWLWASRGTKRPEL